VQAEVVMSTVEGDGARCNFVSPFGRFLHSANRV
jgi:hypothetical protein